MHELSIMKQVAKTALAIQAREDIGKIRTITLLVGEGRNFVQEWVQEYFDMLTEGSDVAGAQIRLETVPVTCRCDCCHEIYRREMHAEEERRCPHCGAEEYEICTGYELMLKNVEFQAKEGENEYQ